MSEEKKYFSLKDVQSMIEQIQELAGKTGVQTKMRLAGQSKFANLGINVIYTASGCNLTCEGCTGCSGCTGCDDTSSSKASHHVMLPFTLQDSIISQILESAKTAGR